MPWRVDLVFLLIWDIMMVILEYEVYDTSCDKTHRGYRREFENKFDMKKWIRDQFGHEILRVQNCQAFVLPRRLN
jgi:hypothetical protein